jgi:DNA invertase Pin-like site-specific DNA recombinase
MNHKIQLHHQQKLACIYLRQSTMFQVMHHQESTDRQYALRQKAVQYGWEPSLIRIMDADLGQSGSQSTHRQDFKALVAEVSMGNVGAIFVLEASRLSRSSADWNRLLELCSLTQTLIIDQDGCYDPSQFNDQLLLGLKGTMSQAELHLIRGRLHGAKINKAKRGELRFPLPVGFIYDEDSNIVFDPDEQVVHVIRLLFALFKEKQSAYYVVRYFGEHNIQFPKRSYGGRWKGKLLWGKLSYSRALTILNHPFYAGVYTYGRYKNARIINTQGEIVTKQKRQPVNQWPVMIKDHHSAYITYEEHENNVRQLQLNKTNGTKYGLASPAREGSTLLQGLLVCGICGRRMTIRYAGKDGSVPTYECNWRKREGLTGNSCFSFRADIADPVIEKNIIEVLSPQNLSIATKALQQIQKRNSAMDKQWEMNLRRCQYNADLAQRRFEQVDPANRLVAASLEKNWNLQLEKLAAVRQQYQDYLDNRKKQFCLDNEEIARLAVHIPALWSATKNHKDKKRIVRLLISDITVNKDSQTKTLLLNIRWQAGATQQLQVKLPPAIIDKLRYPAEIVDTVKALTLQYSNDRKTAELLNQQGLRSSTGKPFSSSMIQWIRYKHRIPCVPVKAENEYTVAQVQQMFHISRHMVYYWIERKYVTARKQTDNRFLITITPQCKKSLEQMITTSYKAGTMINHPSVNDRAGKTVAPAMSKNCEREV